MDRSYEIDKVKKKSGFSTFLKISSNILFAIVVILSIAIAILSSIFLRTPVIGPSMQPTINNLWTEQNPIQDTVLINRLDKGKRNDIIVIQKNAASEVNKYVIKRLIAIGGDKICIRPVYNKLNPSIITNHEILIIRNGETKIEKLSDPYYNDMTYTYTSFMALKETAEFGQLFSKIENDFFITIPEDSIFYLGDNRAKSEDCSKYGPVKVEHIIGKVELIIKESKNIFGECLIFFKNRMFGLKA